MKQKIILTIITLVLISLVTASTGEVSDMLSVGESTELSDGTVIELSYISSEYWETSQYAKFKVDEEVTDALERGDTSELSDGRFIELIYLDMDEAKVRISSESKEVNSNTNEDTPSTSTCEVTETLSMGETTELADGTNVEAIYTSESYAKLKIDSEVTDSFGSDETTELSDGRTVKGIYLTSDTVKVEICGGKGEEQNSPTTPISTTINSQQGLQDQITFEVNLNEGWNLVASGGFAHGPTIASDSQIQSSNLGAIFYYSPLQKKYLQIFPYPTTEAEKHQYSSIYDEEERLEGNYQMESRAYWVYSDKKGTLKFTTDDVLPFDQRQLRTGWNFVSITSEMLDKSLGSFKGSCDIQKFAYYDSSYKKWETSTPETLADKLPAGANVGWYDIVMFEQYQVGEGVLFKVSSDCKLGETSGSSVTPPQIPN